MSKSKVAVLLGYGNGVGASILAGVLRNEQFKVAIVARTSKNLEKAAGEWASKGKIVKPFTGDFSKPATVPALLEQIESELGPIDVAIYNAEVSKMSYDAPVDKIGDGINVNIVSMHAAFNTLLAKWRKRQCEGRFLLTGGGVANSGERAARFQIEFSGSSKAYLRNFAQSARQNLLVDENIHVAFVAIYEYVYGGALLPGQTDPDKEHAKRVHQMIGDTYFIHATQPIFQLPGESEVKCDQPNEPIHVLREQQQLQQQKTRRLIDYIPIVGFTLLFGSVVIT